MPESNESKQKSQRRLESIDELKKKMLEYAEDLNFEKAASLRDRIKLLEKKTLGINGKL